MSRVFIPLEAVRVASPCHADWDMMDGNDYVKLCGSCRKNVYNLSELTRAEAEALIAEKEGNLCVRYYQRKDGTIMTQDCPIGLAKARRLALMPLGWVATAMAALAAWNVVASRTTMGAPEYVPRNATTRLPNIAPTSPRHSAVAKKKLAPRPRATPIRQPEFEGLMGEVVALPVQGTPPPFDVAQATRSRLLTAQRARVALQKFWRQYKAGRADKK